MAEVLQIDPNNFKPRELVRSVEALQKGGIIAYPTETVYGLAADATSDEAVSRVFEAKSRSMDNPISIAISSLSMAYSVGKLNEQAEDLIQKFLPGPLTVVVEKRPILSDYLSAETGKIGLRMPDHPVASRLIDRFDGPITSTSANISGNPAPTRIEEAVEQLGEKVDIYLDCGRAPGGKPSTVVDVTESDIEIVRKGPISEDEIRSVLT